MTTQDQIQEQLNSEYNKFYNEPYKGVISVPEDIMELFIKSVMALASHFHQVHASKIKVISSKTESELSNGDITDMIKLIVNTPLEKKYPDFDTAVNSQIKLEKFILSYNTYVDEFQKKLQQRKAVLTDLTRNVHPNGNGLRLS